MPTIDTTPAWSRSQRLIFRWVALYFALYSLAELPLPLGVVPVAQLWKPILPWIGEILLGIAGPISVEPTGSGDTTAHYVQLLVIGVLASVGGLAWTLLDDRRAHPRMAAALQVWARYWLASFLLAYGLYKLLGVQFPAPDVVRLSSTYGESSPMGLLWTFMGHSPAYNVFTGGVEFLAGLLLISRRTTTLGAMIGAAAMANVVMLNFAYDVAVKSFSVHLLIVALVLVGLDGRRLLAVFVLDQAVPARAEPHVLGSLRARRIAAALYLAATSMLTTVQILVERSMLGGAGDPPLYGLYEVVADERDGKPADAAQRWRQVAVGRYGRLAVDPLFGPRVNYRAIVDPDTHRIELTTNAGDTRTLDFELGEDGALILTGELEGQTLRLISRRVDERELLLVSRGFHWITERSLNQ